jgi:hypothetical protein
MSDNFKSMDSLELEMKYRGTTKKQREQFEKLVTRQRWDYNKVMNVCSITAGREIKSIGRMTHRELDLVISMIKSGKWRGWER